MFEYSRARQCECVRVWVRRKREKETMSCQSKCCCCQRFDEQQQRMMHRPCVHFWSLRLPSFHPLKANMRMLSSTFVHHSSSKFGACAILSLENVVGHLTRDGRPFCQEKRAARERFTVSHKTVEECQNSSCSLFC